MTDFSVYHTSTGRLLGRSFGGSLQPPRPASFDMEGNQISAATDPAAEFAAMNLRAGESAIEGTLDHRAWRIVAGAAVARDPCPITSSVASLVITLAGVPLGAVIEVTGTATDSIINDDASGDLQITLPSAGPYYITADCWPAIDYAEHFTP